jgi:hypothetical protein
MIFLVTLIFLNQTEHKILLQKKPPSISFSIFKSKSLSFLEGSKGDTLSILALLGKINMEIEQK